MAAQMLQQSQSATSRFMDGSSQQMPQMPSNIATPQNRMSEQPMSMMDPMNQGLISSRQPDPPLQTWMQNATQFNQERPMDMQQHQSSMQSLQALRPTNQDMELNKMKFLSTPTQLGNYQQSAASGPTGGLNPSYYSNYVSNIPSNLNEQSMHGYPFNPTSNMPSYEQQ